METQEYRLDDKQTRLKNKNSTRKNQTYDDYILHLFNNHFSISNNECYSLPKASTMFKDSLWNVKELQRMKAELNAVKSYLNDYNLDKWHVHTKLRNNTKEVVPLLKRCIQPEFVTQAWCKFYEIVSSFTLIPLDLIRANNKYFKSVHLCEAPGAFITSLNHWLKTNVPDIQWDWQATTLNPYYEGNSLSTMLNDDRFINHTLSHWCFGKDNTGNIMNLQNLNELIKVINPQNDIFLVTADGSIDCIDIPAEQENNVLHLQFCEIVAALQLLATGGSFLLKVFTTFECNSICLMYLLSCCFENVTVAKPATSRGGNSETYVVCTKFKASTFITPYLEMFKEHYECGPKQAIFAKQDIPQAFVEKIIQCSEFFKTQQCVVIENNVIAFEYNNSQMLSDISRIQHTVANKYIHDYNLKKLESGQIVGNAAISRRATNTILYKKTHESYSERCVRQHLPFLDQIKSLYDDFSKIDVHVSPGDSKNYRFATFPEDLDIRSGKIFHKIYSSKFCNNWFLKMQNAMDKILEKMNFEVQFPSLESINAIKAENSKTTYKVLAFHYTDIYDSHRIITQVHDAVQNLANSASLIITGYPLLTHLTVGLLYLVGCAFNSVEIIVHNDTGLNIILHCYNHNEKVSKFLNEIEAASTEAQKQGRTILQILSLPVLYDGCDLCYLPEDFKHWVIKAYVHYVWHVLKQ